jgi:hypothetical protein
MNQNNTLDELRKRKKLMLQEIGKLDDFRQGSFSPRYRKCGKSCCHCAKEGAQGHGPLWMVTRAVEGKTTSKAIPKEYIDKTFAQINSLPIAPAGDAFLKTVNLVSTQILSPVESNTLLAPG